MEISFKTGHSETEKMKALSSVCSVREQLLPMEIDVSFFCPAIVTLLTPLRELFPMGQLLEEAVSRQVNDSQASVVAAVVAHGETGDVRIDGPQICAGTQLCLLQQARDERV